MLPGALLWGHNEDAGMDIDMPDASTAYIVNLTNSVTGLRYTACAPPLRPRLSIVTRAVMLIVQVHVPRAAQRQRVGLEQLRRHQHHQCSISERRCC